MSGRERPGRDRRPVLPASVEESRRAVREAIGPELAEAFSRVQLLVLDADGILTPGSLLYGPGGEALKEFSSQDGLGLVMARVVGLKRAVLTGRHSAIVARRCAELRFDAVKLGRFDKAAALREILAETGCPAAAALYMGDDLIDIPAMDLVGLAVTVPSAPAEVKAACDYVTRAEGGRGAVREVTDLILKSSGAFALAVQRLGQPEYRPDTEELSSDEKG